MKVIFLDFDGVLNCDSTKDRIPHPLFPNMRVIGLDTDKVKRVCDVAMATGAKVVISSTWREFYKLDDLRSLLKRYGWSDDVEIIGVTPTDVRHRMSSLISTRSDRGDEIAAWLQQVPVKSFVVIDDLMTHFVDEDRQVMTDGSEGFTSNDAVRAIEVLNDE